MKKIMLLAEKDLCDMLQFSLGAQYITLPCCDSAACEEALRQQPDILILSLFLPGTNGLAFLEDNRNLLPPKILVLTRYLNREILSQLSRLGVDAVLRLPVNPNYLLQYLK